MLAGTSLPMRLWQQLHGCYPRCLNTLRLGPDLRARACTDLAPARSLSFNSGLTPSLV